MSGVKSLRYTYYEPKTIAMKNDVFVQFSDSIKLHYSRNGELEFLEVLGTGETNTFIHKDGQLLKIEEYQKGELSLVNNISYDNKGRVILENIQEPIKTENSKYQYINYEYYGSKVALIKSTAFDMSYDYLETRRYNDRNQLIELKLQDLDTVLDHYKIIYNDQGQEILHVNLNEDMPCPDLKISYDVNGMRKRFGNSMYEYLFDDCGNWMEKKVYDEFGLRNILKRDIEYYFLPNSNGNRFK